jgi:serine/threonine-protein kinase
MFSRVLRQDGVLPLGLRIALRYRLERVLGGGGMSTVYEARDPSGSPVALKTLIVPAGSPDGEERRARFLRETLLAAAVEHAHVVPVVDHGVDPETGVLYLVMPLLEGEDMAALLDRVDALDPGVAVALFVQACEGIAVAHARGIVHRDVKPSNLFLEARGGQVVVRITDFGLAKVHDALPIGTGSTPSALTATGRFMGTPQYVSPEQAVSAKHVDERSDVFSLAMSLYHALSGAPAFGYARSFMGLVLEITAREAPHIQDAAPWVPPEIARVVHAALLREPRARCPSVTEFALALDTAVGIDVSRAPVRRDACAPASAARRRGQAPRAVLATSWADLLRG